MRPIKEYLSLGADADQAFARDIKADGLVGDDLRAAFAEFRNARDVESTRLRIQKFLKDRGPSTRVQLFKGLNIRRGKHRIGSNVADSAFQELINEGAIEMKQGSSGPKGGRRGFVFSIRRKRTPEEIEEIYQRTKREFEAERALMPNAILQEVAEDPRSQELVATPKISLDKPTDVCEDDQVAEFRKTELADEPKSVSEPKAQKIRRSALLEGLSS